MTPLERVHVGLIGCGRIASLQVLGYRDHSRAELTAICDNDEALLGQRQQEWQPKKTYRPYHQPLADSDVNAVEILIPHHLHREVAIAALQAGKHVSLQKPPALTLRELDDVNEAAKAAGRRLRVFENFMYYPPHVKARALVNEGAIGEPISVRIKTAAGRFDDGWRVAATAVAAQPALTTATIATTWRASSSPSRSNACTRGFTSTGLGPTLSTTGLL